MNEQEKITEIIDNDEEVKKDKVKHALTLFETNEEMYTSLVPASEDDEIVLFNAISSPDYRISDMINQTIAIKDVVFEYVDVTNSETGITAKAPHVVLIDEEGKSYTCVSVGIYNALKKIFKIKGLPDTWKKPCNVQPFQITRGAYKILSLKMVK